MTTFWLGRMDESGRCLPVTTLRITLFSRNVLQKRRDT
jgi:hypothetical protein